MFLHCIMNGGVTFSNAAMDKIKLVRLEVLRVQASGAIITLIISNAFDKTFPEGVQNQQWHLALKR